ncbi:MAG: molybdopterin molybdotransferase MoeA [Blastochloris sp.]|nr:molybdopterin molybdotransferase MoeA [Blastochloris sp.]
MNTSLLPVADAVARLLSGVTTLPSEAVPLDQAHGRVLADDLVCGEDRPAYDRSAMDGYAVAGDTPARFEVVGEVPAGGIHPQPLAPGQAVRIFTGAAVPVGATRVVPQEVVRVEGPRIQVDRMPGTHFIRHRGDDARPGHLLLPGGTRLRAPELALLAQEGVVRPQVIRRPRLAHLVTGSELVDPSAAAGPGTIRDTNASLVAGLALESGMEWVGRERVGDEFGMARAALHRLAAGNPEFIVVSGGAGPGDHDLGRRLLEDLGMEVVFHGVDLRPGKPFSAAAAPPRSFWSCRATLFHTGSPGSCSSVLWETRGRGPRRSAACNSPWPRFGRAMGAARRLVAGRRGHAGGQAPGRAAASGQFR